MRVPAVLDRAVPPSRSRVPGWLRLAAVPVVAVVVLIGIWLTGAVLTNTFVVAQVLTGGFLALAGIAALVVALRWRSLALPVLVTFAVVAGAASGFLLISSTRNVTVHERVVAAPEPAAPPTGTGSAPRPGPVALARGTFRSGEHPTRGAATVVRLASGRAVLTLTGLVTSPGPDLRVYLVPSREGGVAGHLDLGRLKGNRGDQQYALPSRANPASYRSVVIWCRAFSVAFGTAVLG